MCYDENERFDDLEPWEMDPPRGYGPDENVKGTFKWKAKGALEGVVRGLYTPFIIRTAMGQSDEDYFKAYRQRGCTIPEFHDYRSQFQVITAWAEAFAMAVAAFSDHHELIDFIPYQVILGTLAVTNLVDLVRPRK